MDESIKALADAVLELDHNGRLSVETADALSSIVAARDDVADEVTTEVVPDDKTSKSTIGKRGSSS